MTDKLIRSRSENADIVFQVNKGGTETEAMRITGVDGYVSISGDILQVDKEIVTTERIGIGPTLTDVDNAVKLEIKDGANARQFVVLNTGEVGIGTETPTDTLEVDGVITAFIPGGTGIRVVDTGATSADDANPVVSFYQGDISTRLGYLGYGGTGNDDLYITNDSGGLRFRTGSSTGEIAEVTTADNWYLRKGAGLPTPALDAQFTMTSSGSFNSGLHIFNFQPTITMTDRSYSASGFRITVNTKETNFIGYNNPSAVNANPVEADYDIITDNIGKVRNDTGVWTFGKEEATGYHTFHGPLDIKDFGGGEVLNLIDTNAGDNNTANPYISFRRSTSPGGSTTRLGYFGYGSTGNDDLYIHNDTGLVRIIAANTASATFNAHSMAVGSSSGYTISCADTNSYFNINSGFSLRFQTDSSNRLAISNTSSTFFHRLEVQESGDTITLYDSGGTSHSDANTFIDFIYGSSRSRAGYLGFGSGSNSRLTIYNQGSVGAAIEISSNETADANPAAWIRKNNNSQESTGNVFLHFYAGASVCGGIQSAGTNTAAFFTASDERLKENITNYTDGLNTVMNLQPISFNFKGKTENMVGFSAQNVQSVIPEKVTSKPAWEEQLQYLPEGETEVLTLSGMSHTDAILVSAVKELKSQLDAAKARIDILENQ